MLTFFRLLHASRLNFATKCIKERSRSLSFVSFIMADTNEERQFYVEYAAQGRAKCKTCKSQIEKSITRIGKLVPNPFSEDGKMMKQWYHVPCIFDSLSRARATTKKIESVNDLDGFPNLKDEDKSQIRKLIEDLITKKSPAKKKQVQSKIKFSTSPTTPSSSVGTSASPKKKDIDTDALSSGTGCDEKDNSFREFRRLCLQLADEPSYNAKTKIVANFFNKGSSGDGFKGNLYLWVKLLLPGAAKRVYNLQNKQLIKLYSQEKLDVDKLPKAERIQIFGCDQDEMITDLEQGDVSETISSFFEQSKEILAAKKSTLSLQEVDAFLDRMTTFSKEENQQRELTKITKRCTVNDLKFVVRLIKHDLRMNTGVKHVLDAVDPDAYEAFQASHNLKDVIDRCMKRKGSEDGAVPGMKKKLSIRASVMTPIKPMLAEACKSFATAMKKCPNGMFAEIKYDGERVQVHKSGDKFEFFSRNLKPVQAHKVSEFKDYLPKACPHGNNLILDSEVLLVDNKTGSPLPFGTLGVHKKSAFKDASVCLFIFDIIQLNEENLMKRPMKERRDILEKNVKVIKNRITLSEKHHIKTEKDLSALMMRAIKEGLEGLVLKDLQSIYEPGKRHWLKMKKDYLEEGAMADTADLVVLGAYYGTGNKGGLMSIFLMGVWDATHKKWCTVCRVGNGHDDKTIERINRELKVKKISKDPAKIPSWLNCDRTLTPDFVVEDPKKSPVWEITGAEFSSSTKHTADGVSIRFPRVTRIRDDKDWKSATDLKHLKTLVEKSKESSDVAGPLDRGNDDIQDNEEMIVDDDGADDDIPQRPHSRSPKKMKRKANEAVEDEGISSPKKKRKEICKYGSKCYQTNSEHRTNYDHPAVDDEASPRHEDENKILANIFSGLKFFVADSVKDAKKLKRYIVAYDGDVTSEFDKTAATYIVSDTEMSAAHNKTIVGPDWIWKCIKKKKLLPAAKRKS